MLVNLELKLNFLIIVNPPLYKLRTNNVLSTSNGNLLANCGCAVEKLSTKLVHVKSCKNETVNCLASFIVEVLSGCNLCVANLGNLVNKNSRIIYVYLCYLNIEITVSSSVDNLCLVTSGSSSLCILVEAYIITYTNNSTIRAILT